MIVLTFFLFAFGCKESTFQGNGAAKTGNTDKTRDKSGPDKSAGESDAPDSEDSTDNDDTSKDDDISTPDDDDLGQDDENSDKESDIEISTGINGDCATKTNLVKNSDFENGNSEFTSNFVFDPTCKGQYSPGAALQYSVNSTPSLCHIGYAPSTGDKGKMLVVNFPAAGQSETRFWCQKLTVAKGKHYKISARLRAAVPSVVDSQPTEVTFTIDGKSVIATFRLEKDWQSYKSVEIPGASGDVELCGESRTQNTESTDLIADDFKFAECKE